MWCCGKVNVIETSAPPSDKLKVDVVVAAKPVVLISRAPDLDNQIIVVKKDETVDAVNAADQEFAEQTIAAVFGIALFIAGTYLVLTAKVDESLYIEPPHDL